MTILFLLAALAIYLQYSGTYMYFDRFRFEIKYPLGRFVEMLPLAVTGFALSSENAMNTLVKHRWRSIALSVFVIIMVAHFPVFSDIPGYGYQGAGVLLCASAFVILFYCLPLDHIPDILKRPLTFITGHTMGIYCISFLLSWIGTLLFGKTFLKSLFE